VIEVEGLSVVFGRGPSRLEAVRGASFAIGAGASFGLVGESGCGKSTILRAIAGLIVPRSGRIRLDGREVGRRRTRAQYRLAQMVFQDPYGSLNPSHTVDRILSEPLDIQGIAGAETRVPKALAEVGLGPEHRFRFPHQLSGGQRQRVAIARALIVEPRILLLDEPTSSLDLSVQAEILNLLRRVRESHGLTVMMVSHDLAVIAHMCERIAVMHRGEIVETLEVGQLRRRAATNPYTQSLLAASFESAIPAA
jgi:peptide/nickel transport system ATP-binding protein